MHYLAGAETLSTFASSEIRNDIESVMKKMVITLAVTIAAILFSTPSFAQKAISTPTDVNALVPGMTLRPLNASEASRLYVIKAMNITASCSAVVAAAATVGAVAYDVEAREATAKGYGAAEEADIKARNAFIMGAGAAAGISAIAGLTSVCVKATLKNKTIVRASTGGFVIEF